MLNMVIMIGRLTKEPDIRYTQNNKPVCTFSIAVDAGFGENKRTDFFDVVVWNKTAESCANYLGKGKLVEVDGSLHNRTYDAKDGRKVKVTEIIANNVRFLSPKSETPFRAEMPEDEGLPF